jgi:hypothetical protein
MRRTPAAAELPNVAGWPGSVFTRGAGGTGYVADFKLVRAQREARFDEGRRMVICRWLVGEKIARTLETLTAAVPDSPARQIALRETEASLQEMRERPPQTADALHGIEGRVAHFRSRRPTALKWKERKPIPEEWRRIGPRVSPKGGTNRDATHPVNAMLNYGYAALASQVRIAILACWARSVRRVFSRPVSREANVDARRYGPDAALGGSSDSGARANAHLRSNRRNFEE